MELKNICFLGTSVERGTGLAVVVKTGFKTYLGSMASALVSQEVQTSFDKGVTRFTWLMIRFILVMVPLVFVINGLTKHNWQEAFFFAHGGRGGHDSGDAAHDCDRLPFQGRLWPCPERR